MKKTFIYILLFLLSADLYSQEGKDIIFGAMEKEAQRGMDSLKLPGSPKPFYISYSVIDKEVLDVRSSLGAILYSRKMPRFRNISIKLLLGDYNNSSITNFSSAITTSKASSENDLAQLRRVLWLATDASYKDAAKTFKQKSASSATKNFPDFIKSDPFVKDTTEFNKIPFKRELWEKRLMELSSVFLKYPYIVKSSVDYSASNTFYYFYNTEGIRFVQPVALSTIIIEAAIMDEYGQEHSDKIEIIASSDDYLPSDAQVTSRIETMIRSLKEISAAKEIDEYYCGPVLFEDQSVYKMFMENLIMKNGIVAQRDNINMNSGAARISKIDKSLVSRINKKLIDQKITIKDLSFLSTYNGTPLPGYIGIDAEGIRKEGEITIVDKGILKRLISGRSPADSGLVPTSSMRFSTKGTDVSYSLTPTLLTIGTSIGRSPEKMKRVLLKAAAGEGLKYAYIIRRYPELRSNISTLIYKVDVKTGAEKLVKSAALLTTINIAVLKRIRAVSNKEQTMSLLVDNNPLTLTLPKAILLDDIELNNLSFKKEKPLPLTNPLLRN
ncbi:MAG: hypothetical protein WC833_01880 [Bacteroidales bacterium]|jgi:hypothetical protein